MMKGKVKILTVLALFLIGILGLSSVSVALQNSDISVVGVEVNDVTLSETTPKDVEKNDELDILVVFDTSATFPTSVTEMEVEAVLRGYDSKNKIDDVSKSFNVKPGQRYDEKMTLSLPIRLDPGRYDLRVRFVAATGASFEKLYPLTITGDKHNIEIRDVVMSPENEVKAGRALLASVRLKNRGEDKEEDIKVKVSIPSLGVSATGFIDELDEEAGDDDSTTSEELFLSIPSDVESGEYTVKVDVEFNDGEDKVSKTSTIRVVGSEPAAMAGEVAKTVITIGPESQDVAAGSTVVYPVTISNAGTSAKTYTVDAEGADFTFRVSPSNVVVLNSGESKAIFISATASEKASAGVKTFAVTVSSGDQVLKQVPLKANVLAGAAGLGRVKNALEIGLVVLVVLLVILGLIIGFNKLKGSEEEPKEGESQTYY